MIKHVRLITVHTSDVSHKLQGLRSLERPDLKFDQVRLDQGPSSIESEFDDCLAAPYIAGRAMEAESEGVDALVIDCMGDPSLHATREVVRIPVLGAGETSMHLAAMLGHRFSIVTIMDRVRPILENRARVYGVHDHLASVRAVEMPVLDIGGHKEELYGLLAEEALKAVQDDKADVILLGCTGFLGCDSHVRASLLSQGIDVPVIDPLPATVMMAAGLLDIGLTHSLRTYPKPMAKARTGYAIPSIV